MKGSREFKLIRWIQKKSRPFGKRVILGIGDDASVTHPSRGKSLATVDCLVEGTHFSFKHFSAEDIGHKALAVSLSDIAAMGGKPLHALVSLGVPHRVTDNFLHSFYEGFLKLAKKHGVSLIGGNITRAPRFFADVTVLGESSRPLVRSGARVGDLVGISGPLGLAAAGLRGLKQGRSGNMIRLLSLHQRRPNPRLELGGWLSKNQYVHSAIDVSDGLSSELWHLAEASGVIIEIDGEKLCVSPLLKEFCKIAGESTDDLIWNGGEDYELLVTFDPTVRNVLRKYLTVIGQVTEKGCGVIHIEKGKRKKVSPLGWSHF